MGSSQGHLAAVPASGWRRAVVLAVVVLGVFIATVDRHDLKRAVFNAVLKPGEESAPAAWVSYSGYEIIWIVSLPLWGKLSDVFGRRRAWLAGMLLFVAGSASAAYSEDLLQFAISRSLQGLGVGAIFALGPALIGDLYAPSQRAKWLGVLAAVFGLGFIAGHAVATLLWPVLLRAAWVWDSTFYLIRWTLFLNLLIGGLVILATLLCLPRAESGARPRIDVAGALTLVGAAVPLLVVIRIGGRAFDWLSAPSVALLGGAAVMLAVLLIVERRAADPFINLRFLKNRTYLVAVLLATIVGAVLVRAVYYGWVAFNLAAGDNILSKWRWPPASVALGFVVSALVAGLIVSLTGRYKALILLLLPVVAAGALLQSRVNLESTEIEVLRNLAIMGLGLGGLFAVLIVVAQNAVPFRNLGEVTAGVQFFFAFLGIAVVARIVDLLRSAWYGANLQERLPAWLRDGQGLERLDMPAGSIPIDGPQGASELLREVRNVTLMDSLGGGFLVIALLAAAGFVLATRLPELPLRRATDTEMDDSGAAAPANGGP